MRQISCLSWLDRSRNGLAEGEYHKSVLDGEKDMTIFSINVHPLLPEDTPYPHPVGYQEHVNFIIEYNVTSQYVILCNVTPLSYNTITVSMSHVMPLHVT